LRSRSRKCSRLSCERKCGKNFEANIRKKEAAIADRQKEVARAKEEVTKAQQDVDRLVSEQLAKERKQLSEEALTKASEQVTLEIQDRNQQLTEANMINLASRLLWSSFHSRPSVD